MSWETNTGPLTTRAEAFEMLGKIMGEWSNYKPRKEAVKLWVDVLTALPKRYVDDAFDSLQGEGRAFAPSPGEFRSEVMGIWPLKDCTGEGQAAKAKGRGQHGQQREGHGVAQR